jgi:hypothetical protein
MKYVCQTNLFRAYLQAGMLSDADELHSALRREFDELVRSTRETTEMIEKERKFLGGTLPKELREMANELEEMVDAYSTAIVSSTILAGCVPTRLSGRTKKYLERAGEMVEQLPAGYTKFNSYLGFSRALASNNEEDGGKNRGSDSPLQAFRLAVGELKNADKRSASDLFPEIAETCAEGYFHTRDERFIEEFLQYAKALWIRGRTLSDACYVFCRKMSSLARDRRWGITFYVNG